MPTQSPEDRRRLLAELFPALAVGGRWWIRFGVMMLLSVVVATMGLSENSAAVVIGAMLIAPLMTPVLGIAASVAMAWPKRLGESLLATAVGTGGAIGLAWALTKVLPSSDQALTTEVLARTSPDLRDLLIGVAAGAAGAYAISREDISNALPGVAVALVPPLATIGYTLAVGQHHLAGGALLLYLTNLVAIVLAAVVVFLGVGFVPSGRRARAGTRIRLGIAGLAVVLAGVAVPLSERTASHADTTRLVTQAALSWISGDPALKLGPLSIQGSQVTVVVTGDAEPPSSGPLLHSLQGILGPGAAVQIRWFQTKSASPAPSPTRTTVVLSVGQLRSLVESWLASAPGGSQGTLIDGIDVNSSNVTVMLRGEVAPPSATTLAQQISKSEGRSVNVSINWRNSPAAASSTTSTPRSGTTTTP